MMKILEDRAFNFGVRRVVLARTSIAALDVPVDAVVSSDDNWLSHGGGVSLTIWKAAGRRFAGDMSQRRPALRLGDVFVSDAGELPAAFILHAVTIDLDANVSVGPADIAPLFRRVLNAAEAQGCHSLVVPLLATGAAGLSLDASAYGLGVALDAWLADCTELSSIVVTLPEGGFDEAVRILTDLALREPLPVEELVPRAVLVDEVDPEGVGAHLRRTWASWQQATTESVGPAVAAMYDASLRAAARAVLSKATRSGPVSSRVEQLLAGALQSTGLGSATSPMQARPNTELIEALPVAAQLVGLPTSGDVRPRLTAGLLARDRLAHQRLVSVEDRDRVTAAIREALKLTVTALPDALRPPTEPPSLSEQWLIGSSAPRDVPAIPRAWSRPDPARETPPVIAEGTVSVEPGPRTPQSAGEPRAHAPRPAILPTQAASPPSETGTAHVRRLHELLLTHLDAHAIGSLDQRLLAEGYSGDLKTRVLEKCIRVADPAAFVRNEFGHAQLAATLERLTGRAPEPLASTDQLAQQVVELLGFPRRHRPIGLATIRARIDYLLNQSHLASAATVDSYVAEISRDLEFICQILLRFLCQAAFREAPDTLLRRLHLMSQSQAVDRLGLGTLLKVVEDIDSKLAESSEPVALFFREALGRSRVFPEDVDRLATLRNSLLHHRGDGAPADPIRFLSAARDFVAYLQDPAVRRFPRIVRIDKVALDEWARRVIVARDDEGQDHTIFTDESLEPGQIFLMYPLSNPIRVDPILVPAGNIAWPLVPQV